MRDYVNYISLSTLFKLDGKQKDRDNFSLNDIAIAYLIAPCSSILFRFKY